MSHITPEASDGDSDVIPVTPQPADILAIQNLYGPPQLQAQNDTYEFNTHADDLGTLDLLQRDNQASGTIYNAGGLDTLDASAFAVDQTIDLRGGASSDIGGKKANIQMWFDAVIEQAMGGYGDDTIRGNDASNWLYGMGGDDKLYGFAGNDVLFGDYMHPEETDGDDALYGHEGNDTLYGMNGDDTLDGGAGHDYLYGGFGDDSLTGGEGSDHFVFRSFKLEENGPTIGWDDDTVTDFTEGDQLVFRGGPAKIEDLEIDTLHDGGTRITFEGSSVFLKGFYGRPDLMFHSAHSKGKLEESQQPITREALQPLKEYLTRGFFLDQHDIKEKSTDKNIRNESDT